MEWPELNTYYIKKVNLNRSKEDIALAVKINKNYHLKNGTKNLNEVNQIKTILKEAVATENPAEYITKKLPMNPEQAIKKIEALKKEMYDIVKESNKTERMIFFLSNYFNELDSTLEELYKITEMQSGD